MTDKQPPQGPGEPRGPHAGPPHPPKKSADQPSASQPAAPEPAASRPAEPSASQPAASGTASGDSPSSAAAPARKLPDLPRVTLRGPFWTAEAEVVQLADPVRNWAFRTLFLDTQPRRFDRFERVLLPGTLLALCWVKSVTLAPAGAAGPRYAWRRGTGEAQPAGLTPERIRQLLASGELALVLAQADPAGWTREHDDNGNPLRPARPRFAELVCLAGDVSLDRLQPQSGAREKVYGALRVTPAAPSGRAGAARLLGQMTVHASGLSLFGTAALPWEDAPLSAPFQLARVFPDPASGPAFRLTIEEERLTGDERAALVEGWKRLGARVNPAHPESGSDDPAPRWATLELSRAGAVPRLHWEVAPWRELPAELPLHFERGEVTLLLADQQPYAGAPAPTTLARAVPDDVSITRDAAGLHVEVRAGAAAAPPGGALVYEAVPGGAAWEETVTVAGASLAFSPVEAPRLVRDAQRLAAPEWEPGEGARPLDPAVVWGFVPLADGWAQLPVPNLTEQAYLDAGLSRFPEPAEALLQGAVAFGNDKPGALADHPAEQPWSLTLTNAARVHGRWDLAPVGTELRLSRVRVTLGAPDLVLNGLFWLSAEAPTAGDALPALDDWVGGLVPVALSTVRPGGELFPPVVATPVEELVFTLRPTAFPSAALGAWRLGYAADADSLRALAAARVLPAETFSRHRPLVWRRHPSLPMVQALPLTQSQSPPSHPGRSRQLVPFELPVAAGADGVALPDGWRIGRAGGAGAAGWPALLSAAVPAREWAGRADLPLVALSLPGVVLDPRAAGAGAGEDGALGLPLQYRFDLPYTDEPNALAQLPKAQKQPAPPAADGADGAREGPRPLTRETLGEHFRRLSERASLAAADAVTAFRGEGGATVVRNLVEPLAWPVRAAADLEAYPGALTLADAADAAASLELEGEAALAGVGGSFVESGDGLRLVPAGAEAPGAAYAVEAGSMAAARAADGAFRDQRGLFRSASAVAGALVRTPVRLHEGEPYELTSLLAPVELRPAAGAPAWRFWFRDLPVRAGAFRRSESLSEGATDVNDPEAGARERNHLNGYEWRLELQQGRVPLFGLDFYPLTLEAVAFAGEDVERVEVIGRLQLPLAGGGEQADFGNAVRAVFTRDGGGVLALSAVSSESAEGEWPLALSGGEAGDAPRLTWTSVALDAANGALVVDGARLRFFLFGAEWTVPLTPLVIRATGEAIRQSYAVAGGDAGDPLVPREATLEVDVAAGAHAVSFLLGVRLGAQRAAGRSLAALAEAAPAARSFARSGRRWRTLDGGGSAARGSSAPDAAPAAGRATFAATVRYHLLGADAGTAEWEDGVLFDDLEVPRDWEGTPNRGGRFTGDALHFTWQRARAGAGLQLLPGMHLAGGEAPGFAALSFTAADDPSGVPELRLATAFVEALLSCRWGGFLQDGGAGAPALARVYGSSAGDLAFGYTARAQGGAWDETLLINGLLEVKNLVSWPAAMSVDAARTAVTLPPARTAPLAHTRHTVRVLLNQHRIPADVVVVGAGELLFDLAEGRAWQFLAVAEHQLVDVAPGRDAEPAVEHDRRWCAVQEVRLLRPAAFKAFLRASAGPDTLDPVDGVDAVGTAHGGYLGVGLRERLAGDVAPELDRLAPGTLLVEAGAPHWVRQDPVATPGATTLQYLPNGTQAAVLSGPADYAPSDPADPGWLLLEMPFLGRLQHQARDHASAEDPGAADASALQVDPVLLLARARAQSAAALPELALALAAWGDGEPVRIAVSGLDSAAGRSWARLNPASLEEGWFRAQNPLPEPQAAHLQSVLAALPATAARLSRSVALARAFAAERETYPPSPPRSAPVLPGDPGGDAPVWREGWLLGWQGVKDRFYHLSPPYGWYVTGFQLLTSRLSRRDEATRAARRTYPAATVLPSRPSAAPPLALAVSPYLAVEQRPALGVYQARLVFAELLCLNPAGELLPVGSRAWELGEGLTRQAVADAAQEWARESHVRLAPDSPVALLRFRDLNQRVPGAADGDGDGGAAQAPLMTTYTFAVVAAAHRPERLARRVFRLRSPVGELRFRDGRFGGPDLPAAVRPFEVAPPQTVGVQPLRLTERPAAAMPDAWPWGMSGLNVSVRYAEGGAPAVGGAGNGAAAPLTLWWQAPQHRLQFRAGERGEGPAAGLPKLFRAPAIRGLLPALPDPPLPPLDAAALADAGRPAHLRWQPVLPGALRYLLLGARPGALLSIRHQLLRQSGLLPSLAAPQTGRALVSGSVPAQHRVPRPVPLPANSAKAREAALRPWAGWFDPAAGLLATTAPADEAFFAAGPAGPARRVRMTLVEPAFGALAPGWGGALAFDVRLEDGAAGLEEWTLELQLADGGLSWAFGPPEPDAADPRRVTFRLGQAEREAFLPRLEAKEGGEVLAAAARVSRRNAADGFFQTLAFPLRVDAGRGVAPPLEPRFAHFEDPEYNRRLASAAAHATGVLKTATPGQAEPALRSVTLSADRKGYDADGLVSLRYDWEDDDRTGAARITVRRLDAAGVVQVLAPQGIDLSAVAPGVLVQLPLSALRYQGAPVALAAGDTLQLELRLEGGRVLEPDSVFLGLGVVADPVLPAPEAAFGLLRRNGGGAVECVRFAWGPRPARVELVNPDDLRTEVVRRRAVFHWTDTVRRGARPGYAVQKIAQSGSTHFPGVPGGGEEFVAPA